MAPLLVLPANCTKFKNTGARSWFYAGYPVMIGDYIALFGTISPVLIGFQTSTSRVESQIDQWPYGFYAACTAKAQTSNSKSPDIQF